MNYAELNRKAQLPINTIGNWYKGKRKRFPGADDVYAIAKALDVPMETFFNDVPRGYEIKPRLKHVCEVLDSLDDEDLEAIYRHAVGLQAQRKDKISTGRAEGTA